MSEYADATLQRRINCLSRFDKLPFRGSVITSIVLLALVSILEAFDIGIIGQSVLVLKNLWNLTPAQTGMLGTSSTCGVIIGTFCCGFLADRFGRKTVLQLAVLDFTFFTLITPAVESFYWIVAMRFLAGLGSGAVFPIPYLFISEVIGAKSRGVVFAYCNSILQGSYILPATIGAWAVDNFDPATAWKIPYLVGGLPIIMVWVIHKFLPESPRWLIMNGRTDEAMQLIERYEKSAGVAPDPDYVDAEVARALSSPAQSRPSSWSMIFRPPYLIRTIVSYSMFSAALVFTYVTMVYSPILFQNKGFPQSVSVLCSGAMMFIGVFSGIVCGHFIERYGRKRMYIIFASLAAIFGLMVTFFDNRYLFLCVALVFAFCGCALFSICKLYIAEQYPTSLRGKGAGCGEAVSRIFGGVISACFLSFFLDSDSSNIVFWYMAITYGIAVLLLALFGRETMGRSVDATGASE